MLAILTTHPIQYQVPLWQALAKDGRVPFEVWYLTSHATKPTRDVEFGKEFSWDLDMLAGYPHKFLEVAPGASPNSFWKCRLKEKLRDRLRESGARALWINGWQVAAYWQAVNEAKAAGVEVWLRGESNDLAPTPWWKKSIKRALLGRFFKRVDRFLYIGSANKRLYQKFGVPDEKLFPAPYSVDNERFARQADALRPSRLALRDAWTIPRDAFVILFCGKFIPKKRPMDLIAAATRLLSRGQGAGSGAEGTRQRAGGAVQGENASDSSPGSELRVPSSVHLLFAGSGELGPHLRDASRVAFDAEQGSASPSSQLPAPSSSPSFRKPAASFAGFLNQTEISRAYVAADVLVLPSDCNETWGLVVNEAMASGLPCIVSDRCGCAEDLGKFPNICYQCGDIDSLVAALTSIRASQFDPNQLSGLLKDYCFEKTVDSIVRASNQQP
jgi:glycosyltransferase involved in cell wall biosynthesis